MPTLPVVAVAISTLAIVSLLVVVALAAGPPNDAKARSAQGCSSGLCGAPRRRVRRTEPGERACAPCRASDRPDAFDPESDYEERRARHEAAQRRGKDYLRAKRDQLAYLSGASRREYDPERERLLHDAAIRQYAIDLPDRRHKDRYTRRLFAPACT